MRANETTLERKNIFRVPKKSIPINDVLRTHGLVMFGCMMLGKIISKVIDSTVPVNGKLRLLRFVTEPMVPHIPRF